MEFVNPILGILMRLCGCIAKDVNNIRHLDSNVKALEDALDELKNVSEDVKRRVEVDEGKQMVRKKQVDSWLQKVEVIEKMVRDVLGKANQRPLRSFCFGSPKSCWLNYKLGEEVKEKLKALDELKKQGSFETVADFLGRGLVDRRPSEDTVGLNLSFQEVKRWIVDSQVKVIGVYGMGGVGKTALLKMINNELGKTNYGFDLVIWIVVSKQSNLEKVQEAICEKLRLPESEWRNKSEDEKAVRIFRTMSLKRFMLILDDMWKRVDLEKVGVPASDNQRMSKVVFTTRYEDVCGYMGADKKIKIECLGREEALSLFKKKVGTTTLSAHPSIPKLAEAVAEECRGLLLALVTVGQVMAGKNDPRGP